MIEAPRGLSGVLAAQILLNRTAALRDDETRLASTIGRPNRHLDDDRSPAPTSKSANDAIRIADAKARRVADDILRTVEARLPGRVRDLDVRFEDGQFVLTGVSSSYYVKQMAQHLAMTALEKRMLGRLVNAIEVRSMR